MAAVITWSVNAASLTSVGSVLAPGNHMALHGVYRPSVCLSACLSVCLSVCLFVIAHRKHMVQHRYDDNRYG